MTRSDNKTDQSANGMLKLMAAELRQRAETRCKDKHPSLTHCSEQPGTQTPQDLVHELQVHQIELEMQNEELRQTQQNLEASRAKYVDLYDFAPVGYCTLSENGLVVQANLNLARLLGVARGALLRQSLSRFIHKEDQDIYYLARKKLLSTADTNELSTEVRDCELRMRKSDGTTFWGHMTISHVTSESGEQEFRLVVRDIDAHKLQQRKLQESEIHYRTLAEDMPLYVATSLIDGTLTYVNEALASLIDRSPEQATGLNYFEYLSQEDRDMLVPRLAALTPAQPLESHEQPFTTLDGQQRIHQWVNRAFFDADDQITHFQSVGQDITDRKHSEDQLKLAAGVFTHALEGIMITEPDARIIDVNDSFTLITGYTREDALGQNPRMLSSGRHETVFFAGMWDSLLNQGSWVGEIWNRRKNGEVFAELQTISAVRDTNGKVLNYISLFSDITALKKHQTHLEHIAHFDALTNLPNRVLLADRLHQGMSQAQRRFQKLAVVFLDLDGFKEINDQHGHDTGDQVLITLAQRMKEALREGDTLARLGGDEFVSVLIDLQDTESCLPLLKRLLAATSLPVQVGKLQLPISASLGVTFYPQDQEVEADQLLRQADQAMYQAKLSGKNRYQFFDATQDSHLRDHHESLKRIRLALESREFVMYYQPKVNMHNGDVTGAEALIRWQHPEKGLLAPAAFLPVIENQGIAVEIGEWVIDTVLGQLEIWDGAGLDLTVSINIGARQLQQADFVDRLKSILAKHPDIQQGRIELEVLETSALEDIAQVSQVIDDCANLGVKFALDDFGTGYSSLTYLKRLDVAVLKIDQSFVRDMLDDPDDLAILEGVIGLANAFRREVIAEGVETIEHGEMLLQLGCESAQGYGIARPMPADQLLQWTNCWQVPEIWSKSTSIRHEDLPLLYAIVEHRAWVGSLERYLKGRQLLPPQMDHLECRFGHLLERLRGNGPQSLARFQRIDSLHKQVHDFATELCKHYVSGHPEDALQQLDELNRLRDELIEQLKQLLVQG